MAPFLLDYAFSTAPIPLQVNSPGAHATARINLAVFNRTPAVYCSQIMVAVPVGDLDKDFCAEPPVASVNTGKWTVASQDIVKGEEIGLPGGTYATILFQCRDAADYRIDYSLVLSLVGVPNTAVGTFDYSIQEKSGPAPDNLTPKSGKHAIDKRDVVFSLANFAATAVDKPTVPATVFANGQPLRLSWESTGTWFQLYAKGNPAPLYAGRATSHALDKGLTADSQFVLVASVSGDPSHDSPSPGYQPIYLYDALTLVVANPDLTPKSVTAQNGIATAGALSGGSLAVTGSSTLAGGLDVGTDAAPASVNVRGDLTAAHVKTGQVTTDGIGATTVDAHKINASSIVIEGPDAPFLAVSCDSANGAAGWFRNYSTDVGDPGKGLYVILGRREDYGLWTNARIYAAGAAAPLTHLPTRTGPRVATSPLVVEAEVHLSGSARLVDGKARVTFVEHTADLVAFTSDAPYRALVTPTSRCAGLIIVEKSADHFIVEEAADGHTDASFDWVVIARQRALGEDDAMGAGHLAMALPDALPALSGVAGVVRADDEVVAE